MPDVRVADVALFGDRKVVEVGGMEVGIFRLGDEFFDIIRLVHVFNIGQWHNTGIK